MTRMNYLFLDPLKTSTTTTTTTTTITTTIKRTASHFTICFSCLPSLYTPNPSYLDHHHYHHHNHHHHHHLVILTDNSNVMKSNPLTSPRKPSAADYYCP
ncbi:hypothetical protein E2C01_089000 [Portunus trituberculatus]|uniref:Uncharacterized protein n=1 Tax=Portunus trituberculatus TaxID=210409 RepID=A0A5B7JGY6_PORTR|nr:hypothetical protein [Portunus trituberculatus]